jgi:hypothetical protein
VQQSLLDILAPLDVQLEQYVFKRNEPSWLYLLPVCSHGISLFSVDRDTLRVGKIG